MFYTVLCRCWRPRQRHFSVIIIRSGCTKLLRQYSVSFALHSNETNDIYRCFAALLMNTL